MDHATFKNRLPDRILTERLELRAPAMRDAETLQRLADNENIYKVLARLPHPYTMADATQFIETIARSETEHAWAIDFDGGLVGVIGLSFEDGGPPELGYWLGEPFWGQGFATESAMAVIAAARSIDSTTIVTSRAIADNTGSRNVLVKAGFELTGTHIGDCGPHRGVSMAHYRLGGGAA